MRFGTACAAVAALLPAVVFAQNDTAVAGDTSGPDANGKYTISAEGIRATFVPYGAGISNLFINDTNGIERDIILGWNNASYYTVDQLHPHLGGVPGKSCLGLSEGQMCDRSSPLTP